MVRRARPQVVTGLSPNPYTVCPKSPITYYFFVSIDTFVLGKSLQLKEVLLSIEMFNNPFDKHTLLCLLHCLSHILQQFVM